MAKDLNESVNKTYTQQKTELNKNQDEPHFFGAAVIMTLAKLKFDEELFAGSYTRCENGIAVSYTKAGILITNRFGLTEKNNNLGMAAYSKPR